jgi:hypothetical protein
MFSFALKTISYIFSVLIALASIAFLIMMLVFITKSNDLVFLAIENGLPAFIASAFPWLAGIMGILILGPITLICTNFFQQSKIIQLLEEQNKELVLARYDSPSDMSES